MPRFSIFLIFLALAGAALGADYRLSINATSGELAKAKSIRLFGFPFKKGDRVVAISGGGKGSGTIYRAALDSKVSDGSMLASAHTIQGYGGQIVIGAGDAPSDSDAVWVEKVPPGGMVAEEQHWLTGFVASPFGWVVIAVVGLVAAYFLFFRSRSGSGDSYALPNRRKSLDETLKDIQKRLEKIDENQHDLVKKPPVLRSFRKQIDGFDTRLGHIEGQFNSLQAMFVKTGESLGELDRGQKKLGTHVDANEASLKALSASLESARESVGGLGSMLDKLSQQQESVLANQSKASVEVQSRLAALDQGQQKAGEAVKGQLDSIRQGESSLRQSLAELTAAVAKVQARVEKEVDLSFVSELRSQLESIQKEQVQASKQLAAIEGRDDAAGLHAGLEDLKASLASLQEKQAGYSQRLSALDSLPEIKAGLGEIRASLDSWPISKRLRQTVSKTWRATSRRRSQAKSCSSSSAGANGERNRSVKARGAGHDPRSQREVRGPREASRRGKNQARGAERPRLAAKVAGRSGSQAG